MFMGDFPRISAFYCPSSHFGSFDQTEISNKTSQEMQKLSFTINCRPAEHPRDSKLAILPPLYLSSILSLQPVIFLLSHLRSWRLFMYWMIPEVIGMSCFSYLPCFPRDQVRHEYSSLKNEVNS